MRRNLALCAALVVMATVTCGLLSQVGHAQEDAENEQVVAPVDFESILRRPAKFEFVDTPLSDVAEFISEQYGVNVLLDKRGLADSAVEGDTLVTFSLRKAIPLEAALNLILDEMQLDVVVRDNVLLITSREDADMILTTKVYPAEDLVGRRLPSLRHFQHTPGTLLTVIVGTVSPDTWEDNGGPGAAYFYGGTLVVSQTRAGHTQVVKLLEQLRKELPAEPVAANPTGLITEAYELHFTSGKDVADSLTKIIEPKSWDAQGGEGTVMVITRKAPITNQAMGDVLLVRQTAEIQERIQDMLAQIDGVTRGKGWYGGMGGGGLPSNAPAQ